MRCPEQKFVLIPHIFQNVQFEWIFCTENNLWNLQFLLKSSLSCLDCLFFEELNYLGNILHLFFKINEQIWSCEIFQTWSLTWAMQHTASKTATMICMAVKQHSLPREIFIISFSHSVSCVLSMIWLSQRTITSAFLSFIDFEIGALGLVNFVFFIEFV